MVTCMSTELSFYPVLQGCSLNLEKLIVQHLTPAFRSTGWGKRLTEVKWFLLHCMYVSSDSTATYEILSANCKKPKNTSHPSGMFMSLEPSSLQLPAPSTHKRLFFHSIFHMLWSQYSFYIPQAHPWRLLVQGGVISILPWTLTIWVERARKAISSATALTRRMPRGHSWAKFPSWAGLHWSPHSWAKRGKLDPHPHLPFHWRNWLPFPICDLELVWSHLCL